MEPACEVNKKGTREKNDSNEDVSMDDNERNFRGVGMIQNRRSTKVDRTRPADDHMYEERRPQTDRRHEIQGVW